MHPTAAQSLLVKKRDPIGSFLIGSLVGHGALIALGLVVSAVWGSKRVDLDPQPIHATLVRLGKPRDQKLLPRKEELPPPPQKVEGADAPPTPAPIEKAVALPIPGLKPSEKSEAKRPGEAHGEDRRKQLFGAFSKTGKAGKVEELEGQADGDPNGDSSTAEGERYFALIRSQVQRLYDVSNTIPEQERLHLRAQVAIKVSPSGEVLSVRLAKSSGNALFDSAVMGAVKKASPFSPPPDHLRNELKSDGAILQFNP